MVNVGEKDAYHGLGAEKAENEGFGCDEKPSTLIQTRAYVRPEIWFAVMGLHSHVSCRTARQVKQPNSRPVAERMVLAEAALYLP